MEYYDSINNSLLHSHYSQRNINLLTNPEVVKVLETSQSDNKSSNDNKLSNLNILEETPYKIVDKEMIKKSVFKQNTMKNLFDDAGMSSYNYNDGVSRLNSGYDTNSNVTSNRVKKEELKKGIKSEVEKLENKMNSISNIMNDQLSSQTSSFLERKNQKFERMRRKSRRSMRYKVRKGSKLDDILIAVGK